MEYRTDESDQRPPEQRPVTGEPRVDAALARLDELPELPVTEHSAVFEHIHRSLSEVLGELDGGLPLPGGSAVPGSAGVARGPGTTGAGRGPGGAGGAGVVGGGREGAGGAESRWH